MFTRYPDTIFSFLFDTFTITSNNCEFCSDIAAYRL